MLLVLAVVSLFCMGVAAFNAAAYAWRAQVLRSVPEAQRPEPLGFPGAAISFLRECSAFGAALLLSPLSSTVAAGGDATTSRGAIVLVHDYGLSGGAFWLLRRRLMTRGWRPIVTLPHHVYETDTGVIAARLKEGVDAVVAMQPRQIVLLGHGLGGLAIRDYASGGTPQAVRRLLTLGTPHLGSVLPPSLGRPAKAVAPDGALISRLKSTNAVRREFDVIALHSTFDAVVVPPRNAEYPGVFNVRLSDYGHYSLLFSYKVFTLIEENLAAPIPSHSSQRQDSAAEGT